MALGFTKVPDDEIESENDIDNDSYVS